jgi:type VI secretion system protein ImpL
MRLSWEHLIAMGGIVFVALLSWFSGPWFRLVGWDRAILSGGILLIGAAAVGGFLLWAHSKQISGPLAQISAHAGKAGAFSDPSSIGSFLTPDDIHLLVREAAAKVSSARLGRGAKLADLRVIFILGESATGKTTAILHSGLDPELLAGQVFQEGTVIPTPAANFWFARKSIFVEMGPNLAAQPRLWVRLIHRLTPRGLSTILGRKAQAERAAVVCFDCEKFVHATSPDEEIATARRLRARLCETSQALGSNFPVYVLFTRADRLPFFDDFVRTMTNEESTQVLGVTLPISSGSDTSVYAERETKRLTAAFNALFFSLADCRPGLLSRESNPERQPGLYEFPRQFRKVGKPAVQFLVDLCRPSQLRAAPFLRGFYFTGTREVASSASSPTVMATRTSMLSASAPAANATTILRQEDLVAAPAWQTGTQIEGAEGPKVRQWVFLSHIFSQILLQDRGALGASGVSTRVNFWRRALLATAALLAVVWICGSMVAYISNRALESSVLQAGKNVPIPNASGTQPPSLESLQQLETLRKSLEELIHYERSGVPLHLRWGLYTGHDLYPEARRIYFDRFRQLLFGRIQSSMLDALRRLPNTPGPNDEYLTVYDTLRAYLITTSNPANSSPEFLTPVFQRYWVVAQNLDGNAQFLAREQLNFYANELRFQNPYSSLPDAQATDHARDYLSRFGAVPRIYTAMQNAAAKQSLAVNFYRDHPDANDSIRSVPEVSGAFTKAGWDFMQNAIAHSDQYFRGEEWVLGGANQTISNRADLETQLRMMYQNDYTRQWREFLRNAKVASYNGAEDASRKLKKLSANESPLLALFCTVSQNTMGRSADVDKAFAPVQYVVPAPCESYVTPKTVPYVAGLAKLENCLEGFVSAPPDQKETQQQQCTVVANEVKLVVTAQIMPPMPRDPDGHIDQTVQALLEQPIALPSPPPPTGSGAKGLCDAFSRISVKFPVNPNYDIQDATLQEFDEFFRPGDGVVSKFVQANQSVLMLQGSQYVLKPGAKADWGPAFLTFLSRAHYIQQALYAPGTLQAQYHFSVHATLPEGGITGVTFTMNGQTLKYPGGPQTAAFVWPGTGAQEVRISYRAGGSQETDLLSAQGPWAIIRLLSVPDARVTASSTGLSAEWHPLQADRRTPLTLSGTGKPIMVHLDFESGGMPFVLQSGYFSNLGCRTTR